MVTLDQVIKRIQQIPPMPQVVIKVLELNEDPEVSVNKLIEVIKLDQGVTFRVLRLCNSAYYGLPRKISSLREALVFLGNSTLVNFILTGYAADFFQMPNAGYGLEAGELWRSSVATAIGAELVAERVSHGERGLLFTGGLMHNVGKIILNEFVLADLDRIRGLVENGDRTFLQAEKEVLGFSHAEAGAQLAEHWNLPPVLVECILHCHDPLEAPEFQAEASIVHLAHHLSLMAGHGLGHDSVRYHFEEGTLERSRLALEDLPAMCEVLQAKFQDATELLELSHTRA